MDFFPGKRLSTQGQGCTVRYTGEVAGKKGQWLGVEWDDPGRGKHAGRFQDVVYFTCRHPSPTAASFLRASTTEWDAPRSVLEALRYKYVHDDDVTRPAVSVGGKKVEGVGFDKIARQQARLDHLSIVILSGLAIDRGDDEIADVCPNVTELDLSRNLIDSLDVVAGICSQMAKLQSLKLSVNRLRIVKGSPSLGLDFPNMTSLTLDDMLLQTEELNSLLEQFPSLTSLSVANNGLTTLEGIRFPSRLQSASFQGNGLTSLEDALHLTSSCTRLQKLDLSANNITTPYRCDGYASDRVFSSSLSSLDVSSNHVRTWDLIDALSSIFPVLRHLQAMHNPLFDNLSSADGRRLNPSDGSVLTVARLPDLSTLNHSAITDKYRLDAETWYLSQIALELRLNTVAREEEIKARHRRYRALCEDYGEPEIERLVEGGARVDPNSLAARLVTCKFLLPNDDEDNAKTEGRTRDGSAAFVARLPRAMSIYSVLGHVGKHMGVAPHRVRLMLLTGRGRRGQQGEQRAAGAADRAPSSALPTATDEVAEWDSSEDDTAVVEDEVKAQNQDEDRGGVANGEGDERAREVWQVEQEDQVELVAGTRPLGSFGPAGTGEAIGQEEFRVIVVLVKA